MSTYVIFENILEERQFHFSPLNLISFANIDAKVFEDLNASVKGPVLNRYKTKSFLLPVELISTFKDNLKKHVEASKPLVSWTPMQLTKNQTFEEIAQSRQISGKELSLANGFRYGRAELRAGSNIIVPSNMKGTDFTPQLEGFKKAKLLLKNYGSGVYKVKKGDSLSRIARKFKTKVSTLQRINRLRGTLIRVGQRLQIYELNYAIDGDNITHYVRRGESLYSIARLHKTSVSQLKKLNSLASDLIKIGAKLIVR